MKGVKSRAKVPAQEKYFGLSLSWGMFKIKMKLLIIYQESLWPLLSQVDMFLLVTNQGASTGLAGMELYLSYHQAQ
jgi:hypothetical protein